MFKLLSELPGMGIGILTNGRHYYKKQASLGMPITSISFNNIINITQQEMFKYVHPDDLELFKEKILKNNSKPGNENRYEFRAVMPGGEIKFIKLFTRTIIYNKKNAELFIVMDQTCQKKTEDEIKRKTIALQEIIEQIKGKKDDIVERIAMEIYQTVSPLIDEIENLIEKEPKKASKHIDVLKAEIDHIIESTGISKKLDVSKLTPREHVIASMLRKGMSSKEIANITGTSYQTVEKQRKSIRKKLEINKCNISLCQYLNGR